MDRINPDLSPVYWNQAASGPTPHWKLVVWQIWESNFFWALLGPISAFLAFYGFAVVMRREYVGLDTRKERAIFALKGLMGLAAIAAIGWSTGLLNRP